MINSELYYDILQKKYNILKKNLIIIEQTEEKTNEFKDTIKKLDEIEQDKFKKELELKKELTTNLQDEYKRLCDYINLIESRQRRRNYMLDDYYNIVKEKITDLEEIEGYDSIDFYNKRLDDINEFFENDEKYNKLSNEKDECLNIINDYNVKRRSLKDTLNDFEINLFVKLKNSIDNNNVYNELDFDNIDDSISIYDEQLANKEKELSTYLNSYNALVENSIAEEDNDEYLSFINDLKREYLDILEKKYILLIYKYINENDNLNALRTYEERNKKLKLYELDDNSNLKDIFDIINSYMLKKETLIEIEDTIESINKSIQEIEEKINVVKENLNKENIKILLKEFCIEKEYIVNNNIESNNDILSFNDNFINEEEIHASIDNNNENDEYIDIIETENIDNIDNLEEIMSNEEKKEGKDLLFDLENDIFAGAQNETLEEMELEENMDSIINFDEEDKAEKKEEVTQINEIIYKDKAIKLIKDHEIDFNIEEIVKKALKIMKSVCESVI